MSIANWNPTAFYLIGDEVYDGSANYYYAVANNYRDPPPSANWMLVPPSVVGVSSINGLTGAVTIAGSGATTISTVAPTITVNSPPIPPIFAPSYAEFTSSTSQPLPATVQIPLTYDTKTLGTPDILPVGVYPTSAVQVNTTGIYRVIFSVQIDKFGGGGIDEFQFWFSINGLNVPNTSSKIDITQQINQVMTVESFFSLTAGQTIGVVGYTVVGSVQDQILAEPVGPTHPVAIPSIILNIQRIA